VHTVREALLLAMVVDTRVDSPFDDATFQIGLGVANLLWYRQLAAISLA